MTTDLSTLQWDIDINGGILEGCEVNLLVQRLTGGKERDLGGLLDLADLLAEVGKLGLGGQLQHVGLAHATDEQLHGDGLKKRVSL